MRKLFFLATVAVLITAVMIGGCGKGEKETQEGQKEKFKIPDSLLSPLASYGLTKDDYHPVRGGVMANADIELHYPASSIARFVAVKTFGIAKDAYSKVAKEIGKPSDNRVVLIGAKDLDEYRFLTRKEWWYYGCIKGDTIYFEPFNIMIKRGIAGMGITQKLAQLALIKRSGGRIPIWLREAVASRLAKEEKILKAQADEFRYDGMILDVSPAQVEQALKEATSRADTRIAFYAAYRMLENLLSFASMEDVLKFTDLLGDGLDLDEASRKAFGMDYSSLLDKIRVDKS